MRATTMTPNLPATATRGRSARNLLHRTGRRLRAAAESVAATWSAIADAGQLGPADGRPLGRHTGARI